MPALLPRIDGITGILFHVEHLESSRWEYRWRILGNYPAPYLVWRNKTSDRMFVRIVSEVRGARIEVQWRPDPSAEWAPVDLMELHVGTASFDIESEEGFESEKGFTVCAPVRDQGVAAFHLPPVLVPPGVGAVRVVGRADAPALANVLLAAGEFRPKAEGVVIRNAGPSEGSWSVRPHDGAFDLVRCETAAGRRWFALGSASVSSALLKDS